MKRLHGELLRQGGLARHLFHEGADPDATSDALIAVTDAAQHVERVLKSTLEEYAQLRADLGRAAMQLAGRG